ncbi:MAG: hypothetical protein ACJAWL_000660 [Motiliproteus sp.]|jgi:hypothetical protein
MIIPDRHNTASVRNRLNLASMYLLLALITSACLLQGGSGTIGFAATGVDSGLISAGIEEDPDRLLLAPVIPARPPLVAAMAQQKTAARPQRHSLSLRLIRAPPGLFS